jgi:hypothetical protein
MLLQGIQDLAGLSENRLNPWRNQYGGMEAADMKRLCDRCGASTMLLHWQFRNGQPQVLAKQVNP